MVKFQVPEGSPPELSLGPVKNNSWTTHQSKSDFKRVESGESGIHSLASDSGGIELMRCLDRGVAGLMGKAWRCFVTGKVEMKEYSREIQDFCAADIWTRNIIKGSIEKLTHDPYIFRPYPMTTRTWIYHQWNRDGVLPASEVFSDDCMMRCVLELYATDSDAVATGNWAPLLVYVPMCIILCLSADVSVTFASIGTLCLITIVHFMMNTPRWYRFPRLVTFPVRVFMLNYITQRMGAKSDDDADTAATAVGFFIALFLGIIEIILGDGAALLATRYQCSYEIVEKMPNRVYVCRRHGAAHSQEIFRRGPPVHEMISGIAGWTSDCVIIADIQGIIMELHPMSNMDWKALWLQKQACEDHIHRYVGLDIFSVGAATLSTLRLAMKDPDWIKKREAAAQIARAQQGFGARLMTHAWEKMPNLEDV